MAREAEQEVERARGGGQEDLALEYEKKVVELSREPEPKIGPSANAQEKRGIVTERGDAFRAAHAWNAQRQELGWRQLELRLELVERGRAFIATARERLDQLWGRAEAAMSRIKERVMGEVDTPQAGAERGGGRNGADDRDVVQRDSPDDIEARRAAVLGRDVDRSASQAPDFERERVAPDDPIRERLNAILGRQRDPGQARDAAAVEREIAARDGKGRDQGLRDDILGHGRDSAPERGQNRDRDRDRER